MKLNLSEIIKAAEAEIIKSDFQEEKSYTFSTDTRTITKGQIYIPLKGESFDGADFIENALQAGAEGYFVSDKNKIFKDAKIILYVKDTKEAYLKLANYYKNKINPYTIAITGSSGKTTVKEMMYSVFKNAGHTVKSILNHNNEIGLCQTLSALEPSVKYLIIEMGMRAAGEIELLSRYSQPDIAVIVNCGSAHIGRLGSLLNIAKAKFEITKYLKGVLIAHDNELLRQINDNKHKTVYFSLKDKNLLIKEMKSDFESDVFAVEKDESFESSVNQIYQTFDGTELYPTLEEKAAMLLYLIVKNHSFADGNKRIGASCFLYFMNKNGILYNDGIPIIDNATLFAMTLLIAESNPSEMEIIKQVVISVLNRRQL